QNRRRTDGPIRARERNERRSGYRHTIDRRLTKLRRFATTKCRHHFDRNPKDMKKVPVTDSKEANKPDLAKERSTSSPEKPVALSEVDQIEAEDPMAGLQADLDRFRDLALRSQADFENYKKRCAREKEEAIKYANSSLLERLVAIVDNFELGLSAAREESES